MDMKTVCDGLINAYHDLSPPASSHFSTAARNSRLSTTEDSHANSATADQVVAKKQRYVTLHVQQAFNVPKIEAVVMYVLALYDAINYKCS